MIVSNILSEFEVTLVFNLVSSFRPSEINSWLGLSPVKMTSPQVVERTVEKTTLNHSNDLTHLDDQVLSRS